MKEAYNFYHRVTERCSYHLLEPKIDVNIKE